MEKKLFNWFLLLLIYLPFQIALNPGGGFDLASARVFISLLFLVVIVEDISARGIKYLVSFWNWHIICLFLFLVLACLSLFGAQNIGWGLRKTAYFLSVFPIYFLTIRFVNSFARLKKVITVLIASSAGIALIGLGQFMAQSIFTPESVYSFWAINVLPVFSGFNLGSMILAYPSWLVNVGGETIMRAFSIFSDPHILSFYIGLILPLVLVLPVRRRWLQVAKICACALLFIVLLCTFTRGAYLAVIASLLFLSYLFWSYLSVKKTAILICLPLLIFVLPLTPFSDRFYSIFNLSEGSNAGRLEMWQLAGRTGWEHLWGGIGLGNYALSLEGEFDYRNPVTAHNFYLDLFSETGFLGLTVWFLLIFGTIWRLFRGLKTAEEQRLSIGLIGSLVYFAAHSFFETAVYHPVVLAVFLVVLGLSWSITKANA